MRKRTGRALFIFLLLAIVAIIIAVVHVRRAGPPEAARLLPEGDAALYANLRMLRFTTPFGDAPSLVREPEYAQFVRATGFQFERDLDEFASAVHLPPPAPPPAPRARRGAAPPPPAAGYPRFSHILIGRFDSQRVEDYLRKLAQSVDKVENTEVFLIPIEDRTVRVAILGVDTVAVSNALTGGPMRAMISHYRAAAQPFAGPALVRRYYSEVPFASLAWGVVEVPRDKTSLSALPDLLQELPAGSVLVASARYALGAVQVRAEALTTDARVAQQLSETLSAFLAIFRSIAQPSPEGGAAEAADADVRALLESIQVEHRGDRAIVTATVPQGFIRKALEEPPESSAPEKTDAAPKKDPGGN